MISNDVEKETGTLLSKTNNLKFDVQYLRHLSDSLKNNKNQMGFFYDGIVVGFFLNLIASFIYDFISCSATEFKVVGLIIVFILTPIYLIHIDQKYIKIYKGDLDKATTLLNNIETRLTAAESDLKKLNLK